MAAAAKGARSAGGQTLGITCALYGGPPNPYISHHEEVADLLTRLGRLLDLGDGYVVLPGGSGTLLELALVVECIHKRLMPPAPVLLLGSTWRPALAAARRDHEGHIAEVQEARTPEAVVAALARAWGE
jgi:predicted Rossmann-fold nucleotide-binding protein